MASNSFQQFNPSSVNQETDAQYTADSLRSGGVLVDDILPSALLNKLWYQITTFVAAFAQAMAAKGFPMSDASIATLASTLGNVITTADLKPGIVNVPYSPNPLFSGVSTNGWFVLLTGNATVSFTGLNVGQIYAIAFKQDSSGSRTVSGLPAGAGTIDPGAGNTSVQLFQCLTDGILHPVGLMTVS